MSFYEIAFIDEVFCFLLVQLVWEYVEWEWDRI